MLSDLQLYNLNAYQLIDALNEAFPPPVFDEDNTINEIMFRSGQRNLVELLLCVRQTEEEDAKGF